MDRKYLDILHEHDCVIREATYRLEHMGKSFVALHFDGLAGELFDIADALRNSFKDVNSGYGDELRDRIRQTEQSTANMLEAFVAGASVVKTEARQETSNETP